LLSALGIVFPQFWKDPVCEAKFPRYLKILKAHYGQGRTVKNSEKELVHIAPLVSPQLLDAQTSMFKITMKKNYEWAVAKPVKTNPTSKLWGKLAENKHLKERISEFFKIAELAIVSVIGSVEDERTFSNLTFIKSKLRNKLTSNLETVMRLYGQKIFSIEDFPYQDVIDNWLEKERRGL
jgi:hypothetical protein